MNSSSSDSAQRLAEAVVRKMFEDDAASQKMGMRVVEVRPGYARVEMKVKREMTNGHGTCHGGYVFSLADSAFAFACNSYNFATVAAGCSIDFLIPVHAEDELTAEATEQALSGRSGVYDVSVRNQKRECVALFRGRSRRIPGQFVSQESEGAAE